MSEDYYEILGVKKDASKDEIKKAYWRLAQKHHPDKSGGEAEKFKKINEAYQILSDEEKRAQYDQFGQTFEKAQAQGGFSGFENFRDWASFMEAMRERQETETQREEFGFGDLGSIFEDFFGFSSSSPRTKREKIDIEKEISIDFQEAVFGKEAEIEIERFIVCSDCQGNGREPGSSLLTCDICKGKGVVFKISQTFFGSFRTTTTCPKCQGEGRIFEKRCKNCEGEGKIKKRETIRVKIPAGIDDGGTLRIIGQGHVRKRGKGKGDLYLHVRVKPHKYFTRKGDDIYSQEEISISQAALGGKVKIKILEGEVWLEIPQGTSYQEFRLKNKGVPHLNGFGRGNQIVMIKVKIPKSLTREQKRLLEELKEEGL